jgi:hypothetical protein
MKAAPFLIIGFMAVSTTLAQSSGGDFEMTKSTIDCGGGFADADAYSLDATIGQPDASAQPSVGGEFALAGGFWAAAALDEVIFQDGFE